MIDQYEIKKLMKPFACTVVNHDADEFVNDPFWIISVEVGDIFKYQFQVFQNVSPQTLYKHKKKLIDSLIYELHKMNKAIIL